jgi:hypothetical protein
MKSEEDIEDEKRFDFEIENQTHLNVASVEQKHHSIHS